MAASPLRVTIWNEYIHELTVDQVRAIYPHGLHAVIADALDARFGSSMEVRVATLDEPEHGLTYASLAETDVLLWWGHAAHDRVSDEVVQRVHDRVLHGMGLIALHSAHASKIFRRLMGTSCMLRWREAAEKERVWVIDPGHPVVSGLRDEWFELSQSEMYGEHFDIPAPDELFLVSWFEGGEVFRSGCAWRRGKGKVIYLSPGHETFPIYHNPNIQQLIGNAVQYAAPTGSLYLGQGRNIVPSLSPIAARYFVDEGLHRSK
ncbi:Trehalose utilization [Anatilimnocola aggregata]|uniref:Trehalose utilization n=1 Tax=Anatilimnocola aggregata TaxID=2528021 RepID=A0A517Y7V9_9BACT|nr:ThuA domain-containing protein [Anatilimnocola aggregata]QDU26327.1 Trehalose utilization [Anatilimnocola aggregata]